MNNKPIAYRVEYLCGGCNKAHAWGECTEEQPLNTHPAKELHLSLQKSKETGELLAVTYTDDEHRIVEVLWQKPPAKTLTDEEILNIAHQIRLIDRQTADDGHLYFARAVIKEVNGKC